MYQLSDQLPPSYIARIQERVHSISISDEAAKLYIPDIALARLKSKPSKSSFATEGGTALMVRPVTISSVDDLEIREGHIEILRAPNHELVTSIELLSPANKVGEGAGVYRDKRRALVARGIHVVEIDILLHGPRTELAKPLPPGDYFAMTFRGDRRPDVDVYSWGVRDPLPPIPIPLKGPKESVNLLLADAFASAFDRGKLDRKIDYGAGYAPPLNASDRAWAESILRAVEEI